jgi:tRNA U34 5-carboxymethylaminomethyl modifying GTPase MnmE/TrmE
MGGPLLAAVTTGPASAAIGVIEVTGPGALDALRPAFRPRSADARFAPGTLTLGTLHDDGRLLDEAFLVFRPAAESWTGEELVELQCHGGPVVLDAVLEALEKRGARRGTAADLAARAVRNGKIDAIQAEALACLANARTPLAARVFLDQWNGRLSQILRELLALPPGQLAENLGSLLATVPFGLALSNPPTVVLAGPPNAGKSTLFNAILGADRAIVHETPGTTRDPVDDVVAQGGIPIRLVDTAGVCGRGLSADTRVVPDGGGQPRLAGRGCPVSPSDNPGEGETGQTPPTDNPDLPAAAESATLRALAGADAVLWVVDATQPIPDALQSLAATHAFPSAWVFNKADLLQPGTGNREPGTAPAYCVSALTGQGVPELSSALPGLIGLTNAPPPGAPCVFTERQRDALEAARRALPDSPRGRILLSGLLDQGSQNA